MRRCGTLDVQGAGAPHPAEHLQDLDDAEGVQCALHGGAKSIIGADERRPAHAHLPGLGLLAHHLPRLHRLVRRQRGRGRGPHQPRRRRRQPHARAGAGRRGRAARPRRRDQHAVRRLRGLLAGPRLPGDACAPSRTLPRAGRGARTTPPSCGCTRAAGGGRSGSAYYPGIERMVAGVVDAVEVYNGSWLGERYVHDRRAASPPQLGVARTGGSDAHEAGAPHDAATRSCPTRCAPPPTWSRRSGAAPPSRTGAAAPARGGASASSRRQPCGRFEVQTGSAWSFVDISRARAARPRP